MGTSPSGPCKENCCFQAQNYRSDSQVPTGAAIADQKTNEAEEVEEVTSRIPAVPGKKEEIKLPYNPEAILKKADSAVDRSSPDKLSAQLEAGVLLSQKKKKYWVDKQSKKNCYMLFARDLAITLAEDNRYWKWQSEKETTGDVNIDVAMVQNVCWLEVHGKFNTAKLSPETLYEVKFVVMLKDQVYGWEVPVNIRLTLPSGIKLEHKENLMAIKQRGEWIEIPVDEFKTPLTNAGKIEFSMYEYEGGDWKRGLLIKGAIIRPKN